MMFEFRDPGEFTVPRNGPMMGYLDCYWLVDDQGRIAFYQPSRRRNGPSFEYPQCNENKTIVARRAEVEEWSSGFMLIPVILVPMDMTEYT